MKNMTAKIEWYDPDSTDTIRLAVQAYGIKINKTKEIGKANTILATVSGPTKNVKRFLEDLDEGDIEPFDSKAELSDDEYYYWLETELKSFGCKFQRPTINEED